MRRYLVLLVLTLAVFALTSCTRHRVQNPLAGLDSKQPDKVLFDRAMQAMNKAKYEISRTILQTLINTYPDSEYIARAKLAVGDSWYAEGGTTGLAQAEIEYKDFITFFPNVPEAAEAQLKVANIHYRQMEKPDRDFTHARRAEDEYRNLILQFPDSKLVPDAKQRLRQVQEVLAEREFRIGRFYFLRESFPAAIARLQTLTDSYPLYSQADEALFMLGTAYENEIALTRKARGANEVAKAKLIQDFTDKAAEAYSQIVTRYPAMSRSVDAKKRLQAFGRVVPAPTAEAVAQNKAEEGSRGEIGKMGKVMGNFRRAPDVSHTAKVGEPNLTGTKDTSAPEFVRQAQATILGTSGQESNTVSVETVGKGTPPPNQAIPKSAPAAEESQQQPQQQQPQQQQPQQQQPQQPQQPAGNGIPELQPLDSSQPQGAAPATATPAPAALPEHAPLTTPPPATTTPQPAAAPSTAPANDASQPSSEVNNTQTNAAQTPAQQGTETKGTKAQQTSAQGTSSSSDDKNTSSSKKKKKKGLRKINPF